MGDSEQAVIEGCSPACPGRDRDSSPWQATTEADKNRVVPTAVRGTKRLFGEETLGVANILDAEGRGHAL